eukprot:244030-Prorocentrum_minimum.AAC.1
MSRVVRDRLLLTCFRLTTTNHHVDASCMLRSPNRKAKKKEVNKLLSAGKYNTKLFKKASGKSGSPRLPLKRDTLMRNIIWNTLPLLFISVLLMEFYGIYIIASGGVSTCYCNSRSLQKLSDDSLREFNYECGFCTEASEFKAGRTTGFWKDPDCMVYFDT